VSPLSSALLKRWRRWKMFGGPPAGDIGKMPEMLARAFETIEAAADEEREKNGGPDHRPDPAY
jgi:hypothetical protein